MRELSLFSGTGGGLLGSMLLGWEPIGYVEFNDYCQRVIAQRIKDGILPNAPIFGDIRTFLSEGYAAAYTGLVDVLSGGFPCQPFSVAGKRLGADDERNMWPATAECVRIVRPRYCFFENVPGLLNSGYLGRIVADLAACGYGVRWRVLSAAELGAPHRRDRLWIVAHADKQRHERQGTRQPDSDQERNYPAQEQSGQSILYAADPSSEVLGDTASKGLQNGQHEAVGGSTQRAAQLQPQRPTWWATEPGLDRLANGIPNRVERIRAAGNAQVPIVAATAWRLLTEDLVE